MAACKICFKEVRNADGVKGVPTLKVCAKCGRQGCPRCIKTERCNACEAKRPKVLDEPRTLAVTSRDIEE